MFKLSLVKGSVTLLQSPGILRKFFLEKKTCAYAEETADRICIHSVDKALQYCKHKKFLSLYIHLISIRSWKCFPIVTFFNANLADDCSICCCHKDVKLSIIFLLQNDESLILFLQYVNGNLMSHAVTPRPHTVQVFINKVHNNTSFFSPKEAIKLSTYIIHSKAHKSYTHPYSACIHKKKTRKLIRIIWKYIVITTPKWTLFYNNNNKKFNNDQFHPVSCVLFLHKLKYPYMMRRIFFSQYLLRTCLCCAFSIQNKH